MIKRRKIFLLVLGVAAAMLAVLACSRPPAEAPKPAGPPIQVLKVVKAPEGGQSAEIVQRGDKKMVRLGESLGPEYEDIAGLIFMVDGHHLAYEAKRDGKWLVVLDGKEWPLDAEVVHDSIQVSPDYRRLAFLGRHEGKWQTMLDGDPGPPFDFIWVETLKFSPDSEHVGYLALEANRLAVVVDGKVKKRLDILKEGKKALAEVLQDLAEEPAK
jgi:hypothetical protein